MSDKNHTSLRWDHADLRHYYTSSRQLCQPINDNLAAIYDDIEKMMSKNCYSSANRNQCFHDLRMDQFIENTYNQLVECLQQTAQSTVPTIRKNFFKHWWNEEADALKGNSIKTHKLWV